MKKCHNCSGKGFILDNITSVKTTVNGFSFYEKGIKVPCTKCYGQGKK
jgi:DnaJ-class molecular chaperone